MDMRSAKQDWDKSPGYKVVRDKFALAWWKAHSAAFADLLPLSQRGFVYDAIIDRANIWSRYELLSNIGPGDELLYNEDIMDSYRNASASEIFF